VECCARRGLRVEHLVVGTHVGNCVVVVAVVGNDEAEHLAETLFEGEEEVCL
jgi:hypothetical protein